DDFFQIHRRADDRIAVQRPMFQLRLLIQYGDDLISAGCQLLDHIGKEPSKMRVCDDGLCKRKFALATKAPQKCETAQPKSISTTQLFKIIKFSILVLNR